MRIELLDLPRTVARLLVALARAEAAGYGAATYDYLAHELAAGVAWVKQSAADARRRGLVAVTARPGRGHKAAVTLTPEGRRLAGQSPTPREPRA